MQIRKTYRSVKPELLFDEIRDFILNRGPVLGETKFETYSLPDDSSSFISRGTLTFKVSGKECIRVHLVGSARDDSKVMIDTDETLFDAAKTQALQSDLDFVLGSYEVK